MKRDALYLEVYEERFIVLAGISAVPWLASVQCLSDFSRDSPNYQNWWFKTGILLQVSIKDKKVGLTLATFLFPGVILNKYYRYQPVAGQVFTSALLFMSSLLFGRRFELLGNPHREVTHLYDCRSKQFDLVNLLKNKPIASETEAILVPGDIVYIAARMNLSGNKTDLVTQLPLFL
ncbi:hypothetical protein HDU98_004996 [Podochytrium sp. JEL0797]|nr:hypothetical protein HDU98_004996 [Podochytrium sp. JEL0797]